MSSYAFRLSEYVFKSRIHLLEMLQDRGYDTSAYDHYTNIELNKLLIAQQANNFIIKPEIGPLDIMLEKTNGDKKEKIYIKYRLDEKFRERENLTTQIDEIFKTILTKNDTLILLNISRIYTNTKAGSKPDSGSEDLVRKYYLSKGYFIQIYGLENFLFNVANHQYVPKHEIATKEEIEHLMKTYNITNLRNLPIIKWLDPQAKYIGVKPKSVVKITCINSSTGESIKYRLCVL
jgi:DNA-directed RNA polymerase subunit H (RpoH/RPB5)